MPCDALPFDLCLSVRTPSPDCAWLHDVSLARGNVLLVDHGEHVRGQCTSTAICAPTGSDGDYPGLAAALAAMPDACTRCGTLTEDCWLVPGDTQYGCCHCDGAVPDVRRPPFDTGHVLPDTPLTWAEPLPPHAPVCKLLARDPRHALPQLSVYGGALADVLVAGTPDPRWHWQPRQDLLASGPDDRHFVVEIDDDGAAHLRFGDGVLGAQPQAGDFFRAASRIGNGPAGNVGRDSIVWLALKSGVLSADLVPRNPLPASGGTAPESLAEVKLYAPGAFRAEPLRAIVADDYAMFAARAPELQGAAAALEWSGSWYAADVMVDPLGRENLPAGLARRIKAQLERYRRIGHDVEVHAARYVPLRIALFVCVLPDFLVAHVEAELRDRFGAGLRRDGTPGFFHPDRLKLGAPVFVSALLAEAQSITGVAHVEVTTLARAEIGDDGVPDDGVLHLAAREIAQVDNDPDHPDHGSISFNDGRWPMSCCSACGKHACACGCGAIAGTPLPLYNRPGLDSLSYRVGTYADFRATMQNDLSDAALPALAGLRTREADDPAMALLDAWAVGADVLSFYHRAHRQRRLPAHRHRAALGAGAGAAGRLPPAPRRRRQRLSRLYRREGFAAGDDSRRRARAVGAGARRADADLRDRRAAGCALRVERAQAAVDPAAEHHARQRRRPRRAVARRHHQQPQAERSPAVPVRRLARWRTGDPPGAVGRGAAAERAQQGTAATAWRVEGADRCRGERGDRRVVEQRAIARQDRKDLSGSAARRR